jgi:hypothetical protein
MKKRDKKLQIHRETVRLLAAPDLAKAQGRGPQTSCIEPCCGDTVETLNAD